MTIRITKQASDTGLLGKVREMSGVDLGLCYQCRKCSGGCPVSRLAGSPPSDLIRRLQLGAGDELLHSDLVWLCVSCGTCQARCPMGINLAAVMDTLRSLALAAGAARPKGDMPAFNSAFLKGVETFGRAYDLATIAAYKLRSGTLMNDTDKFPAMLKKGKMAIMPPSGADKDAVKRIFKRARRGKETSQ